MNKNLKIYLNGSIFLGIIIISFLLIFNDISFLGINHDIIITFSINALIIVYGLMKPSKLGYSLYEIVMIFLLIFMSLAPISQYGNKSFPWYSQYQLTDDVLLYANILILVFIITYLIIYHYYSLKKSYKNTKIENVEKILNVFFIFTIITSLFVILNTGFINLFSRNTNSLQIESSSYSLIIGRTFKSVSVLYVAMNMIYYNKFRSIHKKIPFMIGLILMLVVNFPTGSARYWVGSVYLGLFIIYIKKIRNPYTFKLLIVSGMFILFPAINIFRNSDFLQAISSGVNLDPTSDFLTAGDFDAYSMLARAIAYVGNYGTTLGKQLSGNILFFIPRTLWVNKPIGSGSMIGESLNWHFTNVSMPYIGEGYINFGFLGVILFAIVLAKYTYKGDQLFNESINKSDSIHFIDLIYPFTIGFLFFIMRGDLLSSFSYYLGFMVPLLLLYIVQKLVIN